MENENPQAENDQDLKQLQTAMEAVKSEIEKVIVGQKEMIDLLLIAMLADGHVLIEGVPGIAKTLSTKLLAKTVSTEFSRLQFTPDLMPSDVIGTTIFNAQTTNFEFKKGPVFANIILIDEINRAPAKTQAALFEVMEEKQVTMDGVRHRMKDLFFIIATQNPIDMEGTYRLPEAQLDRFLFKIEMDYPNLEEEEKIIGDFHHRKNQVNLDAVQAVISVEQILESRKTVREIHVDENIIKYIAQLVNTTRKSQSLFLGASPRASLAILNGAKANAAIMGRSFITPDDVKFIAPHVLRHRVMLTPEKEMEGITATEIIKELIAQVEIPR